MLSSGEDTIQGYEKGDTIVLSEELIEAGITEADIEISETTYQVELAALLTFSKNGLEGRTIVTEAEKEVIVQSEEDYVFNADRTQITSSISVNSGGNDDVPNFPKPPSTSGGGVEVANETVVKIELTGNKNINATGWMWRDNQNKRLW